MSDVSGNPSIKVSVIMTVFNGQKYIEEAVNSLLGQTLKEIEVIIIDDGSTDNTGNIIAGLCHASDNIKIIRQENSGVAVARNKGLESASGEYIGFVDSDDWCEPYMFSSLYSLASENNLDIAFANFEYFFEGESKILPGIDINRGIYTDMVEICNWFFQNKFNGHLVNKIYKKKLFLNSGIWFEANKIFEEVSVVPRLIMRSEKIGNTEEISYHYRIHKDSYTQTFDRRQLDIFYQYDILEKYLREEQYWPKLENDFKNYYLRIIKYFLNNLIHNIHVDKVVFDYYRVNVIPKARKILRSLHRAQLKKHELNRIKFSLLSLCFFHLFFRIKIRLYKTLRSL